MWQIIWRVSDWKVEKVLKAPFANSSKQETLFRRIRLVTIMGGIIVIGALNGVLYLFVEW